MSWIESHQKLEKHPKLLGLCTQTGWDKDQAIGKLQRLWWWALDYAEDGDLHRYNPNQFLSHINGKISPEKLYKILQNTNWIEKNGLIHDWLDYAGRYLTVKYRTSNPKKLKAIYKKYKTVLRQTSDRLKSDRLDNQDNLPNHKKQSPKLSDDEFLKNLKTNSAYKYIDIDNELGKMDSWLLVHKGRQKTRRFIVNWLNKIDRPIGAQAKLDPKPKPNCSACKGTGKLPDGKKCWCW